MGKEKDGTNKAAVAVVLTHRATDKGWAWVMLVTSFSLQALSVGLSFSAGVYIPEWLITFGRSQGETAWILSINTGMFALAAPLSSVLINRFGFRPVAMAGGVCSMVGCLISGFVTNIYLMYFTYGFIAGLGFSFYYVSGVTVLGIYFHKRKVLAMGLSATGVGMANLVFPPLLRWLMDLYGWRGCMIVMAGFCLNACVFGALIRPVEFWTRRKKQRPSIKQIFQLSLLKDIKIWLYFLNNMCWNFGFILLAFAPDYAKECGFDPFMGALIISIIGITSASARVVTAFVAKYGDRKIIYTVSTALRGATIVIFPLWVNFVYFAVIAVIHGLVFGVQLAVYAVVTVELFGVQKFPSAFGYSFFGVGVGGVIGLPIAGWLHNVNDSYDVSFYFGGTVTMFAAVLMVIIIYIEKWQNKIKQREKDDIFRQELNEHGFKVSS